MRNLIEETQILESRENKRFQVMMSAVYHRGELGYNNPDEAYKRKYLFCSE